MHYFLINQKFNKIMSKVNKIKTSPLSKSFSISHNVNINTPHKLPNHKTKNTVSPIPTSILVPIPVSMDMETQISQSLSLPITKQLLHASGKSSIKSDIYKQVGQGQLFKFDDIINYDRQQQQCIDPVCQYCLELPAIYSCCKCNTRNYCKQCFQIVHSTQKFIFHIPASLYASSSKNGLKESQVSCFDASILAFQQPINTSFQLKQFKYNTASKQNLLKKDKNCQISTLKINEGVQNKEQRNQKQTTYEKQNTNQLKEGLSQQILNNQIVTLRIKKEQLISIYQQHVQNINSKWNQLRNKIKEEFNRMTELVQLMKEGLIQQLQNMNSYQLNMLENIQLEKAKADVEAFDKITQKSRNSQLQTLMMKVKQIKKQIQEKTHICRKFTSVNYNFSKEIFDRARTIIHKISFQNSCLKSSSRLENFTLLDFKKGQNSYMEPFSEQSRILVDKKHNNYKLLKRSPLWRNQNNKEMLSNSTITSQLNCSAFQMVGDQPACSIKKVKSEKILPFQTNHPFSLKINKRNKIGHGKTHKQ